MDVYFGVGGELLSPLDEMMDGDIKLSLELDLELENAGNSHVYSDYGLGPFSWGSLRSSPILDPFGEKENCIMVSPEAVMPLFKREIKHEPPPTTAVVKPITILKKYQPHDSLVLECEEDETEVTEETLEEDIEEEDDDEEEEEDEDDEEEEEEEEEQVVREIKILPKDRSHWNTAIQTKPTVVKDGRMSFIGRQKTEIIVAKTPSSNISQPQQTVRVLHAMKKSNQIDSSPSRSVAVKRIKESDGYPKPAYSYSCLIAMALKNSVTGSLPVSEIYKFMCEHFPYFETAPSAWKNSVRHNLSLNQCFEKIEKGGAGGGCRKGCLWAMNPEKIAKMDDEVAKWSKKDPNAIKRAMKCPDELDRLVRGDLKIGRRRDSYDSGAEEDESNEGSESDSDTEEVPPSLKRFDSRLSSQESNDLGLPDEMYEELGILEEVMSSDPETEPVHEVKRIRLGLDSYQRQSIRPV